MMDDLSPKQWRRILLTEKKHPIAGAARVTEFGPDHGRADNDYNRRVIQESKASLNGGAARYGNLQALFTILLNRSIDVL